MPADKESKKKSSGCQILLISLLGVALILVVSWLVINLIGMAFVRVAGAIASVPPGCGNSVAVSCSRSSSNEVVAATVLHKIVTKEYAAPLVRIFNNVTGQVSPPSISDPHDESSLPQLQDPKPEKQVVRLGAKAKFRLSQPLGIHDHFCWMYSPVSTGSGLYLYGNDLFEGLVNMGKDSDRSYDSYILDPVGTIDFTYWIAQNAHCV